jgi:hypothetical protein
LRYKVIKAPKKLKICPVLYLGLKLNIPTCHQKPNPSRETVPLNESTVDNSVKNWLFIKAHMVWSTHILFFLQRDQPPGPDPVGDIDQRYNSQVAGLESSWVGENGSGETGDEDQLGSSRPYPLHHKPTGNIIFLFWCE